MKCGECILKPKCYWNGLEDGVCNRETERVAALMEQLPEVKKLIEQVLIYAQGMRYRFCKMCELSDGAHESDCPVAIAQKLLGGGK